jgi:hypothetical protein
MGITRSVFGANQQKNLSIVGNRKRGRYGRRTSSILPAPLGQWMRVRGCHAPLLQSPASNLSSPPWSTLLLRWLTELKPSMTS